jgi:oligoendopeptidase F
MAFEVAPPGTVATRATVPYVALVAVLTSVTMMTTTAIASAQATDPAPDQIEWDLSEIYPSFEAWDTTRGQLATQVEALAAYRGRLGESAATLREAFDAISGAEKELSRLYVFAFLKADEDRRVSGDQERRGLAAALLSEFGEAVAFLSPELLGVGSPTIERFLAEEPGLARHAFNIRNILRQEPHTLSDESEQVIAATGPVVQGAERIYAMLTSSDLPFPTVTLSSGEEITLDQAAYSLHRASSDRADRKLVFDTFWGSWKGYETSIGQTLDTQVKAHVFQAKVRHYDSALDAALSGSNIPTAVYHKLVEAAHRHLPSLHRYFKIRQRMLGLDDLHYYDIYPSLVASDRTFDIDESKALTLASAAPLGSHYLDLLREGFAGNWMHVYPQTGKAPGAYMYGSIYDLHPFLLLNHNGQFNDVSTFTHEWGHAIHTMLSTEHNPYETSSYATFTAEIASTTNEVLLQEHMLAQDISDNERLFYLGTALEAARGTFFRQVMFAEFELKIHEMVEAGEALSGQKMSQVYEGLLRQYHGAHDGVMAIDQAYAVEWAFIPHFYRNFYVFQYATSIAGGTMFAERFLTGDEQARDDYLAVLSAGGSRYAYELLQEYGIDLATDAPYDALIARMDRVMDQIEAILDRQGN